jgi:Kef-type K+ transport system membrane component KefB
MGEREQKRAGRAVINTSLAQEEKENVQVSHVASAESFGNASAILVPVLAASLSSRTLEGICGAFISGSLISLEKIYTATSSSSDSVNDVESKVNKTRNFLSSFFKARKRR